MNITDAEWEKATGRPADPAITAIEKRINGAWAAIDGTHGCPICDAFGQVCCKEHNTTAVAR